jgi:hypothetical protein
MWSVMVVSFEKHRMVRPTVTIEGLRAPIDYLGGHASRKIWRAPSSNAFYFAAVTMISTVYCGAASFASTVARAGVLPGDTQASHTAFISPNVLMSVM